MQHLDEGTIHAWLDGALDAEESARVEEHVATCAACAAAVAEARGLVAGSSRILSALDHVPRVAVGESRLAGSGSRGGTAWRVLRFTPARAAAAAVLVVAVGSMFALRANRGTIAVADREKAMSTTPDTVAIDMAASPPAVPAPAPSAQGSNAAARENAPRRDLRDVAVASGSGAARAAPMQGKAMRGASEERQKLRGGVLSAVGGVAAERVASAPVGNKLDSARAAPTVAVTPAARDSAVRSTTGQQKMAARAFGNALADSLARNRSTMQLSEVVASSANVSLLRARETSVAGCYVVAGATVVGIPTRLSLDTTAVGVDGSIGAASAPASGAAAAGATRRRAAESRPVAAPAPALVAVRPARALSAVDDAGASTRVIGAEWTLLPSGNVRVVLPGAPSLLSIELRRSGSDLEEVTLGAKDATRLTLRRVDCRR